MRKKIEQNSCLANLCLNKKTLNSLDLGKTDMCLTKKQCKNESMKKDNFAKILN